MDEFEQKSSRDRSGQIGGFNYHFHGAGCRLEKDGIVCEFDFMPTNEYPIKFCLWKMSEFIIPNKACGIGRLEESELHEVLHTLVDDDTLLLSSVRRIPKANILICEIHYRNVYIW